jgi:hypothetical protein
MGFVFELGMTQAPESIIPKPIVGIKRHMAADKLENTASSIIVNVAWMINEENTHPFLDHFP